MTPEEFSNEFDTLVNSYSRIKDFDRRELLDSIEFNEYEKSLFLTKAQETVVLGLYNGKNPFGDVFEGSEEMRRHLSTLVREAKLSPSESPIDGVTYVGMELNSKFYKLPSDLWFITFEGLLVQNSRCDDMTMLDVIPVKQDEYHKLRKNPFRGANSRRALRLDLSNDVVEIDSDYENIEYYYIRYIERLTPILLVNMPDGLTIDHVGTKTSCKLHECLHRRILETAVEMALRSKGISASANQKEIKEK